MDKNWLIRTKSNHILGPVSKEKVVELFQNGSLKANDEICSGNGFWFFIREEDMVARYLLGNERQAFNPLSEAKDVLTLKPHQESSEEQIEEIGHTASENVSADITMVGSLNLADLDENKEEIDETPPASIPEEVTELKETLPAEEQKKNKPKLRASKKNKVKLKVPVKKHSYLKYVFFFFILILLSLTYFRKHVIRFIFDGEMTAFHIISPVQAQTEISEPKKKSFFENQAFLDGVVFKSEIGLDGFNVISQINLASFQCEKLKTDIFRLALLLFPTDRFNEKLLIKIRECVIEEENAFFSNWLKTIDQKKELTKTEQRNKTRLTEVLNSPYNLITDQNLKSQLTSILIDMPEDTLGEVLLKSWLFLMLGNITRSDNLLKDFINTAPYYNWKKTSQNSSFYHTLGGEFLDGILEKLAKHPSDRLIFKLFCEYMISYYSDEVFLYKIKKVHSGLADDLIKLEYVKRIAPPLVNHLRLKGMSDSRRVNTLRDIKIISLDEQSLWHWPFLSIDPLITDAIYPTLKQWEEADQLWFIYLMHSEKMIDVWSKNSGRSFIHGRRQFLRQNLLGKDFMLSLFKLIEFGDIDQSLVDLVGKRRE